MKSSNDFQDLVKIMKILRKECPWDRRQTHESIKDHLIEEAYETIDAIDRSDPDELKKELGDVLLHVIFHSCMAAENGDFTIEDVILEIQKKLIRRHPHVFGDAEVKDEQDVSNNWEAIKMREGRTSLLDGLPPRLPALIKAYRMQQKAGSAGFDWKKSADGKRQLWEKLQEELDEFKDVYDRDELNRKELAGEFGDLLFSIVNAGRFLDLKAEDALRLTNRKFQQRFRYIEERVQASNQSLQDVPLVKMEEYWQEAKEKPRE